MLFLSICFCNDCRLVMIVQASKCVASFVFTVIVGVLGIYYFLKRRWMVDDEETRQMLYYVDKILGMYMFAYYCIHSSIQCVHKKSGNYYYYYTKA